MFTRDIFFRNKGVIPFWNFPFWQCDDILCYLLWLFICLFTSNMSPILLLPTGDFVYVPLVLCGFSFLVVVEIGSLARFTCFSNVDLFRTLSSRIPCLLS